MYIKTDAIVLREVKYKESDMLLTLLTRESGKVFALARGVRKPKSRLNAACQLYAYSSFTIFENRGRHTVDDANVINLFGGLRGDLEKLSLAAYFSELLELLSEEGILSDSILSLGLNTFYALANLDRHLFVIKPAFELKLLSLSGYEPAVAECSSCGRQNINNGLFNIKSGLLFCSDCMSRSGEGVSVPINDDLLAAMRHIVYDDGKKLFSFMLPEKELATLADIIEAFVHAQLERGFKTLDFFKSLTLSDERLKPPGNTYIDTDGDTE